MEKVYGPELNQVKSCSEVLQVIKDLESSVAIDEVLNFNLSRDEFQKLIDEQLAEKQAAEQALAEVTGENHEHVSIKASDLGDNVSSEFASTYVNRYAIPAEVAERIKFYVQHGLTLEEMSSAIFDDFALQVSVSRLRTHLRMTLNDVKTFRERYLNPCYSVIYVDIDYVRMQTKATLTVEHPFYFIMGIDFNGDRDLLAVAPFPRDYEKEEVMKKMWVDAFTDLKTRGLVDPIYFVTGPVEHFREALREVYPRAIYQHSIADIIRQAVSKMNTRDRAAFTNESRVLYNCKALLECMRSLTVLDKRWGFKHPEAIKHIRENFVFFEQYYAASRSVRISIRTTKVLFLMLNDLRRDIREDHSFLYCDALHVVERTLEVFKYISKNKRPMQWKRALKSMLDDRYIGNILYPYIDYEDVKLSVRSCKRDVELSRMQEQAAQAALYAED